MTKHELAVMYRIFKQHGGVPRSRMLWDRYAKPMGEALGAADDSCEFNMEVMFALYDLAEQCCQLESRT